ncbi:MAG: hypothetical protein V4701_05925 [Pseudomonadota bacterium]
MFKSSFIAAISAALALAGVTAMPDQAWAAGATATTVAAAPAPQGRTPSPNARGQRRAAPPTPEQSMAAAQTIATSASVACQVTQANPLGMTAEQAPMFEAACATGPGYILVGSTPPQAIDCVLLAGQAAIERARDPAAAAAGVQCVIPQNADVVRVLAAYATEAGIPCTVNEGASIGKSGAGNLVYEIGCDGVDGYWLERETTGWKKTECANVITQNATCRFSTVAEQAATLKSRFAANAEAAACDVSVGRYMGANANGSFYEAKCAAGNGVIVRFDTDYAVQQVYPCETAQRIGGGCTLTIVPPAPEAAAPAPATQQ